MYAIESKDNFRLEAIALLGRIQAMLAGKSSNVDANVDEQPSKAIATNMSILSTHEYKIKEAITWVESMSNPDWVEYKADLQKDFEEANKALSKTTG